jgi:NTE family protein
MSRKIVGLALGGGAARGLAHIGVLEILQKENIPIDMIAGTSAGALVGAIYAQGKSPDLIKNEALSMDRRSVVRLLDLTLPRTGLIGGRRLHNFLRKTVGGEIQFSDLKIPVAVVATDIITGEEVVIKEGSVLEAVRASIAIPIVFTIAKWQGRYLVDGELVDPVPVKVAREMGADVVIAVNVIPDPVDKALQIAKDAAVVNKPPGLFHVILQSIYISTYSLVRVSVKDADVLIEPNVAQVYPHEFSRAQECIRQGEIAAQVALPEIKRLLKGGERKPQACSET